MRIEVKCFATLSHYAPSGGIMDVPEASTVEDIISLLNIPDEDVKIRFVNGVHVEPVAQLNEGDRLGLFPAVGGG